MASVHFHPRFLAVARRSWWPAAVLVLLAGAGGSAQAGGPRLIGPDGQPYRWDMSQPIRYAVSSGSLGSHSHAWAVDAVARAVRVWESVATARVQFEAAGGAAGPIQPTNPKGVPYRPAR